ncbi:MAG: ATP-binding protein [Clostridia bacterium]|nr:ATP-binding protein [Clostridia bacterium]
MTSEQIILQLQQEYARRREDNLHLFEERQDEACNRCPGLRELIAARHASVMQGVKATLLARQKAPGAMETLPNRMAEMNSRIAQTLENGGFPADYLQPVYTCAVCRDEGYLYDPSRRMCDCMKKEYHRRLLAESGVAGENCTFEKFDENLFSDEPDEKGRSQRKSAVIIRDVCQTYADSFPNTPTRDLLLMGKSGLGKTFMLQAIAHRVAQRGHLPTYVSAYRLFENARKAYMENDSDILAPFMNAELLLIDDLGTEPLMNNVTVTQLFNLLNERQMAGRHTVISTNLAMSELQERYTERISSRFLDATGCRRLVFIGADIRRNLKRKAAEA